MIGVAVAGSGRIIINGKDVTDQFVEDASVLNGTFTAESSNVLLAKRCARHSLPYLIAGCDVDMYYNGPPGTLRITITVPAQTVHNAQG